MSKLLKSLMRDELKARFDGVDGGLLVSSQGLNSEKTYSFRKTLHEQGIKFTIIRNSLAREAFISIGLPEADLDTVLSGPLGVVYTKAEESATTSARAVAAWKKDNKDKAILVQGAFLDGAVLGPKPAAALKDAPTKDGARAQLLGIFQAPVTQFLATIREPHARVIYLLNAYKEKLEGK